MSVPGSVSTNTTDLLEEALTCTPVEISASNIIAKTRNTLATFWSSNRMAIFKSERGVRMILAKYTADSYITKPMGL